MIEVIAETKFNGSCSEFRKQEFTSEEYELLSIIRADQLHRHHREGLCWIPDEVPHQAYYQSQAGDGSFLQAHG